MAYVSNDELLIILVEQCAYLYDKASKSYKDERLKENTWKSIAEKLETEPAAAKQRWVNLRDRFVRAYRDYTSQPPSGSAGGCPKTIGFPFFGEMIVACTIYQEKEVSSDVTDSVHITTQEGMVAESETDANDEESFAHFNVGDDGVLSPAQSIEVPIEAPEVQLEEARPEPQRGTTTPKRKKTMQESMNDAISTFTDICKEKLNTAGAENSDLNFMKSVVHDMQALTPKKKLRFKKDLRLISGKCLSIIGISPIPNRDSLGKPKKKNAQAVVNGVWVRNYYSLKNKD
nr:unnamed protein product [Callosobruchus chinensis]